MSTVKQFGYCPKKIEYSSGRVSVTTHFNLEEVILQVKSDRSVRRGWMRADSTEHRVFGLPKTHTIEHQATDSETELMVWLISFILGIRLTCTEAGFLDATPIQVGTLHDIVWIRDSESRAIELADEFVKKHAENQEIGTGVAGVIHSLFLSQTPSYLEYEIFIYCYIAFDGCFAIAKKLGKIQCSSKRMSHAQRVANLCEVFGCPCPDWAIVASKKTEVSVIRNDSLHEGLFWGEPLGFNIYGGIEQLADSRNRLLEMQNLITRFLFGILGFDCSAYVSSQLDSRQRFGVELS